MMIKRMLYQARLGILLLAGVMIMLPDISSAATDVAKPVLIFADVSGSMKDKTLPFEPGTLRSMNWEGLTKVEAEKELVLLLTRELAGKPCGMGIYEYRYIAGDQYLYVPVIRIGSHEAQEMTEYLKNEFVTDYGKFNRRTPMADALRQLDEKELDKSGGNVTILLISDGNESFYSLKKDRDQDEPDVNDRVKGPLTEVRRLKKKYGQALTFYTIYMETLSEKRDGEEKKAGEALLAEIATAGEGKAYSGAALLADKNLINDLANVLCYEKPVETQAERVQPAVEPVIAPAPVDTDADGVMDPIDECPDTPQGVNVYTNGCPPDSDQDGVYDYLDKCPGTPKGAKVNSIGCWILTSVNFDTAKWNIKPEFNQELNQVIEVLERNPDLRIEVQGHTDNKASAAYNEKLSEKRARSVMDYFIQKGVDANRLTFKGYGFRIPMVPNDSTENMAKNRRVELKPIW